MNQYSQMRSTLLQKNVQNKRFLIRVDYNVPLQNGTVAHDHRLRASLPTINYILKNGGLITLITHIGRPKTSKPILSTQQLVEWFKQKNYKVIFAKDIQAAQKIIANDNPPIVLLENLRFFPGEKQKDYSFAKQLATLGDEYVQDGFGVIHRADASVALTPTFFEQNQKTIGLLIEKELITLNDMIQQAKKPFVAIIGGGKIADKIPILEKIIEIADTILLCPAIVFTFLKAQNKPIGASLVDNTQLQTCKKLLEKAAHKNLDIHTPIDYVVAHDTFEGPLHTIDMEAFSHNDVGITIGLKTVLNWDTIIQQSGTVFYNGLMGSSTRKATWTGNKYLFKSMAQSQGKSIISGGDSVAIAESIEIANAITFCSTGGGATLQYICSQPLPGLDALKNGAKTQ